MGLFDAFGVGGGDLSIQVQFPQVQAGSVVNGVVMFAAGRRAQQITNIKVTLNCTTHQMVHGQPHPQQRSEAVAPPMIVSGPFTTQPGQQYQFPFQIQVPPSAFGSQPNAVSYRVSASADIDGEVDPGAGQDIQVVGAPYGMNPGMQPGMQPMGGPSQGWDQGGGYASHGVDASYNKGGYDPSYDKAAAMKGGYDPSYDKAAAMKGGYDPSYDKAAAMKGGYDPSYDKAAAMKGGYDPSYDKAAAMKGGYNQGYDQGGHNQGGGFAPGAHVQAQWTDGGWYGVTVVEQRGEMVLVQWDDGTPASWVGLHQIAG